MQTIEQMIKFLLKKDSRLTKETLEKLPIEYIEAMYTWVVKAE